MAFQLAKGFALDIPVEAPFRAAPGMPVLLGGTALVPNSWNGTCPGGHKKRGLGRGPWTHLTSFAGSEDEPKTHLHLPAAVCVGADRPECRITDRRDRDSEPRCIGEIKELDAVLEFLAFTESEFLKD